MQWPINAHSPCQSIIQGLHDYILHYTLKARGPAVTHTQFKPIATVWYVGQGSLWEEGGRCEKEDSLDGGTEEGENP